mgnify:CR=1 FL=1
MGETIKERMYSVFPVVAMHRIGIDSFRLAISLNKYSMHTKRISQRTLSSMAVNSLVILWFCKDLNWHIYKT